MFAVSQAYVFGTRSVSNPNTMRSRRGASDDARFAIDKARDFVCMKLKTVHAERCGVR
jgi:hypothetical protein